MGPVMRSSDPGPTSLEARHEPQGDALLPPRDSGRSPWARAALRLQAGQFIGSRNDFVPDAICQRLCLLMDKARACGMCGAPAVLGVAGDIHGPPTATHAATQPGAPWWPLARPQVPPMSPDQARSAICQELGVEKLSDVFEWIDLDKPLGSASVAQARPCPQRPPSLCRRRVALAFA